jgi:hypothetical protein
MGDVPQRMRFSERIRWLIQRNARFGGTGVVHRRKVKEIGTNRRRSAPTSTEGDRHQPRRRSAPTPKEIGTNLAPT